MDEDSIVPVSPRHAVRLAREYVTIVEKAQRRDFVVRTITRREAGGVPLMSAEIVIAGEDTRAEFPLSREYPCTFAKLTFGAPAWRSQGRIRSANTRESADRRAPTHRAHADRLSHLPPTGQPYSTLSPFAAEPEEANIPKARKLRVSEAAGLWLLAESAFAQISKLHEAGLSHGDTELHNFIVCPSPLEILPIDFEGAAERTGMADDDWNARVEKDVAPLLRQAVLLECALGAQAGPYAELAHARMKKLFKDGERFGREIERRSDLD